MNNRLLNKNINKVGSWPSWQQNLLLKAALLSGKEAIDDWKAWQKAVDLNNIDHESQMLLPLLYRNLSSFGIIDPEMKIYLGVQRKTWAKNHLVLHELWGILQKFQDAGIKTMLLKGSAMITLYYKDFGLRPMRDVDILVPTEKAMESMQIFLNLGWEIQKHIYTYIPEINEKRLDYSKEVTFINHIGLTIDLHWHLIDECTYASGDDDFWLASVPVQINGNLHVCTLNPTDQLLYTIVQGSRSNPYPLVHWASDAILIMNQEQELDWERLISQAKSRRIILPVKNGLNYLNDILGVAVPNHILNIIRTIPVTPFEFHELYFLTSKGKFFAAFGRKWYQYRRLENKKSFMGQLGGFLKFLQYLIGAKHLWQLPVCLLIYGLKRTSATRNMKY